MLMQEPPFLNKENPKKFQKNFEKELMVFNLRTAVEIFGKDYMRRHFKGIKSKSQYANAYII